MHSPRTTVFIPPPQPAPTLEADITCTTCGYNVRGMTRDDRCPECGQLIPPSIARSYQLRADPHWAKAIIAAGVNLILSLALVTLATALVPAQISARAASVLILASYVAAGISIWLIATPQDHRGESCGACITLRIAATILTIIAVCAIMAATVDASLQKSGSFFGVAYFGTAIVTFFYYWRVAELARRYRWFGMQTFARGVGIGLAITTLFGASFLDPYIDYCYGTMPMPALGAAGSVAPILRLADDPSADIWNKPEFYFSLFQPLFEAAALVLMLFLCLRMIILLQAAREQKTEANSRP